MVNKFPSFNEIYKMACSNPTSGSFAKIITNVVQEIDDSISEDEINNHLGILENFFREQDDEIVEFDDKENFVVIKGKKEYMEFCKALNLLSPKSYAKLCCDILNKSEKIKVEEVADNSQEDANTIDIKGKLEDDILGIIDVYSQVKCFDKKCIGLNSMKQFVGGVIKNISDENKTIVHPYILTYFVKNGYDDRAKEFALKTGIKCYTVKNIYDFCSKYKIDLNSYK